MNQLSPSPAPYTRREAATPEPPKPPPSSPADAAVTAYVGCLAAWFDFGRLVAGQRLNRARVENALLNDA